jgi:hypothetical protein
MAFDIKEDREVMVQALRDSFPQGGDLFVREIIPMREGKEMANGRREKGIKV